MKQNLLSKCKRLAQVGIVLALPIGIDSDPDNRADFVFGLYGGTGKYVSLVESCEGPTRSAESSFTEGAFGAFMRVPTRSHSPVVVGLAGGLWRSDITLVGDYVYDEQTSTYRKNHIGTLTYGYVIPSIGLEAEKAAIGVGVLVGKSPVQFDENMTFSPHFAGHARVGRADGFHISYSLNENMPLISGGGNGNIGLGFSLGEGAMMYHGLSVGGYHYPGLVHQLRLPLDRASSLDVSFRWGATVDETKTSEIGFSVGFRRYFGSF